ncbi:hypothetical protein INT47_001000 [Mucor saturninus]|uniref:Histone-lysine N-methyltransferase SET9 n=1 Tax=Mucor saturninus TaxID=64648 RepID=A0A8H7RNY9_9FUNG|nr:hypothetical protein INT47_001000 [Mucor saturninus]
MQQQNNLMDFKVLSRYDDLFTDIFLDNLFLWFNTIKMNNDHRKPRVPNNKILDIIQRNILENARPMDAVNELLSMDYFKHYLAVKNPKQVQEFIQHMKRYLYMYMPNAGYEVGDTRRYGGNGRRVEACLVATKDWHVGDEMRLLTGMIACLDPKDDAELKKGNRDFSVMWSTRKNCSCLFLGPARFANHDCDSNCKFISLGQNSITFKVVKEIKFGQEITVYYGKHYFGENNGECRCITCEKQSMGYFATLETPTETTDIKEDDSCGTRRSTRKRKPALHEDYTQSTSPRRSKRPSIEPTDSLEELIGSPVVIKDEPIIPTLPPLPPPPPQVTAPPQVSPPQAAEAEAPPPLPIPPSRSLSPIASPETTEPVSPTTERMSRLKVMTIGFLCGSDREPVAEPERRISDCPLLDLLVDAVMDVEYLEENNHVAHKSQQGAVTVVVNPEIHRDATHRVLYQQQQLQKKKQHVSSPPPSESNESKADSAVSLSPRFLEKKEDHCWRREMDDGLFSKQEDEDRFLDDFFDDVSDLSSVSSSAWSSDEEDEAPVKPTKKKPTQITTNQDLTCIACSRPLKKQDISEQVGADMSITNELATWTWSPSAIFTDWRPKRCPRCERHFTIFKQEWPNRKIKKKKAQPNKKSKKMKKSTSPSSVKKTSRPCSPFPTKTVPTINPNSPIYQMQDDPQDLNYIPPSPLSEVVYDEDDTFS